MIKPLPGTYILTMTIWQVKESVVGSIFISVLISFLSVHGSSISMSSNSAMSMFFSDVIESLFLSVKLWDHGSFGGDVVGSVGHVVGFIWNDIWLAFLAVYLNLSTSYLDIRFLWQSKSALLSPCCECEWRVSCLQSVPLPGSSLRVLQARQASGF